MPLEIFISQARVLVFIHGPSLIVISFVCFVSVHQKIDYLLVNIPSLVENIHYASFFEFCIFRCASISSIRFYVCQSVSHKLAWTSSCWYHHGHHHGHYHGHHCKFHHGPHHKHHHGPQLYTIKIVIHGHNHDL